MSAASESRNDLALLLSALADGTLDDQGHEQLAAMLRSDPAARAKYYESMQLAALLRREGRRAAAEGEEVETSPPIPAAKVSRPTKTRRLRAWLLALAASIVLGLLLSVGEATGVTQFVPTLIRIVTGEGELVIEVDDPAVSVTLDGEDITITGAGIHELRLRPGTHKFIATKNGQPWREEVVTIERGGRQVVKVTREAAAAPELSESRTLTASEQLDRARLDFDEAASLLQQGQELRFSDPLESERCLRRALALHEQLAKDYPGTAKYRDGRSACRWWLATTFNMRAIQIVYQDPPPTPDEARQAVALATEATTLTPTDAGLRTTLGRAHYRAGNWNAALEALDQGPSGADYNGCRNRFFLALVHWQLGHFDQARQFYDEAVKWMDENQPDDAGLRRDRAEAAALFRPQDP